MRSKSPWYLASASISSADKQREVGGKFYLDYIEHSTFGLPAPQNTEGILYIADSSFTLIGPAARLAEKYDLSGATVTVSMVFSDRIVLDEVLLLYTATITATRSHPGQLVITTRMGANADITLPPTKTLTFSDYPNAPLANIGDVIPIVFGDMNVGGDPYTARLAKAVCTDILSSKFTPGSHGKTYGDIYVYDRSLNKVLPVPHTQAGEIATLSKAENLTSGALPLDPTSRTQLVRDASSIMSAFFWFDIPPGLEDTELVSITVTSGWMLTAANSPGSYFRADLHPSYRLKGVNTSFSSTRRCTFTVQNNGSIIGRFVDGSYLSGYNAPQTWTDTIAITDWGDLESRFVWNWTYYSYNYSNVELENLSLSMSATATYKNPFKPSQTYETTLQAVVGYKDMAANYADGGVVNTADLKLTSPIDVLLALLRDKDVGMGKKVADIDVSVPAIRTALGTRRVDGQLTEPMTSEHLSRFARQHDMAINVVGEKFKITHRATNHPVALFTGRHNILRVESVHASTAQVKNAITLRYNYSHITGKHHAIIARNGTKKTSGTGSIATKTLTGTQFQAHGVLPGDRVYLETATPYYDIVKSVESEKSLTLTTGIAGNAANTPYTIGTFYDHRCAASIAQYSEKVYTEDLVMVADDSTAEAVMDQYIDDMATPKVTCVFGAAFYPYLENNDTIAIDSRHIAASDLLGKVTSTIYRTDSVASLIGKTNVASLPLSNDFVFIESADPYETHFEIIGNTDGQAGSRGMLNSRARAWPAGAKVRKVTDSWRVVKIAAVSKKVAKITAEKI